MSAIFQSFYKTVTGAGVSEVLGASTIEFNVALFIGNKAKDTWNTSNVQVELDEGSIIVAPGVGETWRAPAGSYTNASEFNVRPYVAGDGVLCVYSLADYKSFSDIELTVEEAIRKYLMTIGATLDDCSFTTGISTDERTSDNINVYVSGATERIINSGVWDCSVTVQVRSQVGKESEDNPLDRHRLRTAYVRDLILEPEAEEWIASMHPRLSVYDDSIRDVTTDNSIEDRTWISDMMFTITVMTSGIK
jgi:hypothetical protein